ncbi:hypothetical protein [Nocardia sp. NPDC005745]|uniref:hypothetical protein n=1 Tax=Nocardia sp. NPDC005745 TaxID=3157061 RepID=UPI0033E85D06
MLEPDLPTARLDGPAREVKLLSDYRHTVVVQRTELINRLRWHLYELDPSLELPSRDLRRCCVIDDLAQRLTAFDGLVAQIARGMIAQCRALTEQINNLERQLRDRVRVLCARHCTAIWSWTRPWPESPRPSTSPRTP